MTIEASLKGSSGLSNILNPTYSARDKIYDIRCGTCNVVSDLVGIDVAMAVKVSPSFIWSLQTTHRLVPHLKLPCWVGGEFTSVRGGTLARTIKSRKLRGRL